MIGHMTAFSFMYYEYGRFEIRSCLNFLKFALIYATKNTGTIFGLKFNVWGQFLMLRTKINKKGIWWTFWYFLARLNVENFVIFEFSSIFWSFWLTKANIHIFMQQAKAQIQTHVLGYMYITRKITHYSFFEKVWPFKLCKLQKFRRFFQFFSLKRSRIYFQPKYFV